MGNKLSDEKNNFLPKYSNSGTGALNEALLFQSKTLRIWYSNESVDPWDLKNSGKGLKSGTFSVLGGKLS